MPKLSDNMDQFIADNYPELEDEIREHFNAPKAPPTNEMKQVSLDSNSTIDSNIDKLVDIINDPGTSPQARLKALSAYKMISDKIEATPGTPQPPIVDRKPSIDTEEDPKEKALKRMQDRKPAEDDSNDESDDEDKEVIVARK